MPHKLTASATSNETKAERARRYLTGGGVAREDSDDELGLEDYPWEWIRRRDSQTEDGHTQGHESDDEEDDKIIGARMGDFECLIGDCVLLKAEGSNEAWIGLICEFEEGEEEDAKGANFMWFSTEREIRNKEKKRTDALPNEVYITPSWDVNPLSSINGRASIVSLNTFKEKYPSMKIPRNSKDHGKMFICRRGCNTRTATYTEEFIWEETYQGAEDIYDLVERVKSQTKATRKRRREDAAYERDAIGVCPSRASGLQILIGIGRS